MESKVAGKATNNKYDGRNLFGDGGGRQSVLTRGLTNGRFGIIDG